MDIMLKSHGLLKFQKGSEIQTFHQGCLPLDLRFDYFILIIIIF